MPPIIQLLTALRFYSTGCHLTTVADFAGMHTSTASRIVTRVSRAIARLYKKYIKFPTTNEEISITQNEFFELGSFPQVIGCVDGTHIKIQCPGGDDGEIYRNRLKYFSINVQGICNSRLEFTNVVARWPGSAHDATVFNNSRIRQIFESNVIKNCWLLGDSAYALKSYLLTPLAQPSTPAENLYQKRFTRTRNTIERCFGVWKRRFPVMAFGCKLHIDNTLPVIIATAVLNNVAIKNNEEIPPTPDEIDDHSMQQLIKNGQIPPIPVHDHTDQRQGFFARNSLIRNFFQSLL